MADNHGKRKGVIDGDVETTVEKRVRFEVGNGLAEGPGGPRPVSAVAPARAAFKPTKSVEVPSIHPSHSLSVPSNASAPRAYKDIPNDTFGAADRTGNVLRLAMHLDGKVIGFSWSRGLFYSPPRRSRLRIQANDPKLPARTSRTRSLRRALSAIVPPS